MPSFLEVTRFSSKCKSIVLTFVGSSISFQESLYNVLSPLTEANFGAQPPGNLMKEYIAPFQRAQTVKKQQTLNQIYVKKKY